ncbi:MAG: hypothetical protein KDH96_08850, partial [Candidatus Riesia sp.]|nr:hypothetical protein [Candidatus Riesia sp.]
MKNFPKALGSKIIIKKLETVDNVTKTGLVIVKKSTSGNEQFTGEVVQVGRGFLQPSTGETIPLETQVGDRVIYTNRYNDAENLVYEGEDYLVISESSILCVLP